MVGLWLCGLCLMPYHAHHTDITAMRMYILSVFFWHFIFIFPDIWIHEPTYHIAGLEGGGCAVICR